MYKYLDLNIINICFVVLMDNLSPLMIQAPKNGGIACAL